MAMCLGVRAGSTLAVFTGSNAAAFAVAVSVAVAVAIATAERRAAGALLC
jgi:hypothetical protein